LIKNIYLGNAFPFLGGLHWDPLTGEAPFFCPSNGSIPSPPAKRAGSHDCGSRHETILSFRDSPSLPFFSPPKGLLFQSLADRSFLSSVLAMQTFLFSTIRPHSYGARWHPPFRHPPFFPFSPPPPVREVPGSSSPENEFGVPFLFLGPLFLCSCLSVRILLIHVLFLTRLFAFWIIRRFEGSSACERSPSLFFPVRQQLFFPFSGTHIPKRGLNAPVRSFSFSRSKAIPMRAEI